MTELVNTHDYVQWAIELCANRHKTMMDPDSFLKMNLTDVLRSGKAPMVIASLALGSYQQRLAEKFDITPGAEMKAAIVAAQQHHISVWLIDRDIGITLKRVYRNVPWWRRCTCLPVCSPAPSAPKKSAKMISKNSNKAICWESTFTQFAEDANDLFIPLIQERDPVYGRTAH